MRASIGVVWAALVALPLHAGDLKTPTTGQALEPQTREQEGIAVTVAPRPPGGAGTWDFEVTLEAHTRTLNDDVAKSAVLVSGSKESPAIAWEGDPAGGHHRKGVLRFRPISPPSDSLELHFRFSGDTRPRVFRWELGEGRS